MSKYRVMKKGDRYFIQLLTKGLFMGYSWQNLGYTRGGVHCPMFFTKYYNTEIEAKTIVDYLVKSEQESKEFKESQLKVIYKKGE